MNKKKRNKFGVGKVYEQKKQEQIWCGLGLMEEGKLIRQYAVFIKVISFETKFLPYSVSKCQSRKQCRFISCIPDM